VPAFSQDQRIVEIAKGVSVVVPPDWEIANQSRDSLELYLRSAVKPGPEREGGDTNPKPEYIPPPDAGMLITVEHRRDHRDALKRLAEISVEFPERAKTLVISGWPAIERTYSDYMPRRPVGICLQRGLRFKIE
jgi:hypothetical protein